MRSVLIANRGEIAVRIVRACRERDLRTVAVYSDADADALHVALADDAYRIGPAPARASYLSADAVLAAAATSGADAVHPGYGLLSEDARFAAAVRDAGLTWIGPPPDVIERMGDKVAARRAARDARVPVLPGSEGTVDADTVHDAARAVGFPLVLKASFGGGGRGMRVVRDESELDTALASAAREAGAAFGRDEVYLERHLDRPRHVEVQVLADAHGAVVHLGDRDCSTQRRHQKLIEEAPAPGLPAALRRDLREAAVALAREVGYVGAGTVEFLVADGAFSFLEMNTRLQVEHGVTELVTGVDLVVAQLRVADGERLGFPDDGVPVSGHAMQARIAAEDPWSGFAPSPGTITGLQPPTGPWVRSDLGVRAGDAVAREYDSLIGKILTRGPDRDTARRRLAAALDELVVDGIPTTAPYLRTVLDRESFVDGTHDTGSVERDWAPDPATRPRGGSADPAARSRGDGGVEGGAGRAAPSDRGPGATSTAGVPGSGAGRSNAGRSDAGRSDAGGASDDGAGAASHAGGSGPDRTRRVRIVTDRGPVEIAVPTDGSARPTREAASDQGDHAGGPATGPVAPMDATVVEVPVAAGATVAAGDVLVVLEAMKMEIEVRAPADGTVDAVLVAAGSAVGAGTPLVELTPPTG